MVTHAGASSNCAPPLVSECGKFAIQRDPFISTGVKSDKVFRDAGGRLNPATEIKLAPVHVCAPANKVHIVPGFRDNLFSASKFVDAGYACIFEQDEVGVYDKTNTEITTSWAVAMKRWHVPGENVWRFRLQQADGAPLESNTSPQELLRTQPPSLPDTVSDV